jgi:hypothetical protein
MPATLAQIRTQQASFYPGDGNRPLQGISGVLRVYIDAEPKPSDLEVLQSIRADLPPSVLYHAIVLSRPHLLHRILRDYLVLKNKPYVQHEGNNRVVYGLPRTLYDNEHELSSAFDALARSHPYSTDHTKSQSHPPSVGSDTRFGSSNEPPTKIARNMALRFNNRKFS